MSMTGLPNLRGQLMHKHVTMSEITPQKINLKIYILNSIFSICALFLFPMTATTTSEQEEEKKE